jgi:hypothetical protein
MTTGSAAQRINLEDARQEQGLRRAIADARRSMLDPTRRNRLLHAPLFGKRPWCLAIMEADVDEIFHALVRRDNCRLSFAARPSDEGDNGTVEPPADTSSPIVALEAGASASGDHLTPRTATGEIPRQRNRIILQTRLSQEQLDRRLTKIFRDARSLEEEQGLSTLFLAMGFLNWYESDDSQEMSTAPLILVPVYLERARNAERYVLASRDDDLVVNISLQQKFRDEFGLMLPDLPEGDEWTASQYLLKVLEAVQRKRRWEVDSHAVGLGFFTFSKFLMWKDLDPESWPQGKLLSHHLLNGLLGREGLAEVATALVTDDEPIDQKIDLAQAVHILDADSSQAVVVEEARQGRNLVVQGPPGTGKSQTIANLIASAVHAGRSVLFVAEKTTALEVVHKRLRQAGLGALCLEMIAERQTGARFSVRLSTQSRPRAPLIPYGN